MYYDKEIKGGRKTWTSWLEGFSINETRDADPKDRRKIATSISNNFHKKKRAVFVVKNDPNDPFKLLVTRTH